MCNVINNDNTCNDSIIAVISYNIYIYVCVVFLSILNLDVQIYDVFCFNPPLSWPGLGKNNQSLFEGFQVHGVQGFHGKFHNLFNGSFIWQCVFP